MGSCTLTARPVCHAGLGISDLTQQAPTQYKASKAITMTLVQSIVDGSVFNTESYKLGAFKVHRKLASQQNSAHTASLK